MSSSVFDLTPKPCGTSLLRKADDFISLLNMHLLRLNLQNGLRLSVRFNDSDWLLLLKTARTTNKTQ
jgi:hypothetical protein